MSPQFSVSITHMNAITSPLVSTAADFMGSFHKATVFCMQSAKQTAFVGKQLSSLYAAQSTGKISHLNCGNSGKEIKQHFELPLSDIVSKQ